MRKAYQNQMDALSCSNDCSRAVSSNNSALGEKTVSASAADSSLGCEASVNEEERYEDEDDDRDAMSFSSVASNSDSGLDDELIDVESE